MSFTRKMNHQGHDYHLGQSGLPHAMEPFSLARVMFNAYPGRRDMNYTEWEAQVWSEHSDQKLWEVQLYRIALFAADLAQRDIQKLAQSPLMEIISKHLTKTINAFLRQPL